MSDEWMSKSQKIRSLEMRLEAQERDAEYWRQSADFWQRKYFVKRREEVARFVGAAVRQLGRGQVVILRGVFASLAKLKERRER